jgi:hypothetical protein
MFCASLAVHNEHCCQHAACSFHTFHHMKFKPSTACHLLHVCCICICYQTASLSLDICCLPHTAAAASTFTAAAAAAAAAVLHTLDQPLHRTGNTVMYRSIDLKKVDWAKVSMWPKVRFIRLLPTNNPGVVDFTAAVAK